MVPWVGLQCVISVFLDNTNLIFGKYFVALWNIAIKHIFSMHLRLSGPSGRGYKPWALATALIFNVFSGDLANVNV